MKVPHGWRDSVKSLDQPASVTLRFAPATGDAVSVQASTVWLDAAKLARLTDESLKAVVAQSAEGPLRRAEEEKAVIQEVRGQDSHGFYYSLTDRAPGQGEHKYLIQGSLITGELMTAFTILYHEPASAERDMALQMLASARHNQ